MRQGKKRASVPVAAMRAGALPGRDAWAAEGIYGGQAWPSWPPAGCPLPRGASGGLLPPGVRQQKVLFHSCSCQIAEQCFIINNPFCSDAIAKIGSAVNAKVDNVSGTLLLDRITFTH